MSGAWRKNKWRLLTSFASVSRCSRAGKPSAVSHVKPVLRSHHNPRQIPSSHLTFRNFGEISVTSTGRTSFSPRFSTLYTILTHLNLTTQDCHQFKSRKCHHTHTHTHGHTPFSVSGTNGEPCYSSCYSNLPQSLSQSPPFPSALSSPLQLSWQQFVLLQASE